MKHIARALTVFGIYLLIGGCSSSLMKPAVEEQGQYSPTPDEAQVIFMRPSNLGAAIQSSVFDLEPDNNKFIGIVSYNSKVRYITNPGEHLFMVIGESADFMKANLAGGKTYYALVSPRMGWWKARFSLLPIRRVDLSSEKFTDWDEDTVFVETTPEAQQWAEDNRGDIEEKRVEYIEKWNAKSPADKSERTLHEDDGI